MKSYLAIFFIPNDAGDDTVYTVPRRLQLWIKN